MIPKFDEANLQAISDIIGDTSSGLTGSEIGRYLRECGIPDPMPQMTKRHRLYAALSAKQDADRCAEQRSEIRHLCDESSSTRREPRVF
jgi:hypothetical protein